MQNAIFFEITNDLKMHDIASSVNEQILSENFKVYKRPLLVNGF